MRHLVLLPAMVWLALASAASAPAAPAFPAPAETDIVWVRFTDRGLGSERGEQAALEAARGSLSAKARARRAKVQAPVDLLDVPPSDSYVDAVRATGARVRVISRWLNAVSVQADGPQRNAIRALPFVADVRAVAARLPREKLAEPVVPVEVGAGRSALGLRSLDYGDCSSQILPIQVDLMHDLGLSGAGVTVAVLDTGFKRTHVALDAVDVLAEHDFVQGDGVTSNEAGDDVSQHNHGTEVLSLIAGWDPGHLIGPAYGASYALAKTETLSSETPIEEDWWIAGAEWADSLGADVITTSLGYKDWYTYEDMDGNTAPITIAADLAVGNGICVLAAAGNEGQSPWLHVIAPADGDSVVSVGAVDSLGTIVGFSSRGPTFDGRIKPDVCAMGRADLVALPSDDLGYGRGSGTSFSTPIVAGVVALLLEANPAWGPIEVREALRTTASRASHPDNDYGWGIVQAREAALSPVAVPEVAGDPARTAVYASPNPSRNATTLRFTLRPNEAPTSVTVYDVTGRVVRTLPLSAAARAAGRVVWNGVDEDGNIAAAGLYFARLPGVAARPARIVRLP